MQAIRETLEQVMDCMADWTGILEAKAVGGWSEADEPGSLKLDLHRLEGTAFSFLCSGDVEVRSRRSAPWGCCCGAACFVTRSLGPDMFDVTSLIMLSSPKGHASVGKSISPCMPQLYKDQQGRQNICTRGSL